MEFSQEEIEEFKNEALELLDESERHLLCLEKGGDFKKTYDAVFRVFHSLKGGAGMLNLLALQSHMHQLENHYQQCKPLKSLSKEAISYFLKGVDGARHLLDGREISFVYKLPEQTSEQNAVAEPPQNPKESKIIENQPPSEAIQQIQSFLGTAKIMIIDDEIDIVSNLKDLLEEAGFSTVGFTSPKDALGHLKTEKPDVVLTDIKMNDLNGFELLKLITKQDPDLPVVFISGFITKELIIEALTVGVFAAIEKPFSDARVIEICTNASQRYQLTKLLNNLISFVYYQYPDLEQHWKTKGGDLMQKMMQSEFRALIEAKRKLKFLRSNLAQPTGT